MMKCVLGYLNGLVVSILIFFEVYGICVIKNNSFLGFFEIIELEDFL